ncbi:MAG TPA: arginine--tRNA ligase [Bacteroidales bacterium]|nr:arginine--tRNA ligase [Bacteroidales bacterium]
MLAWQKWGDINSYLDWCINNTDEIVEKIRTLVKQNIFNYCKRIVLSYKNGNIGRSIDENYKQEVIGLYEKTKSNKNPINQLVNILENHEIYLKDSKNYKLLKRRIDKQKRELEFRNEKIEPKTSGKKGDHLVGDFYVKFDQEYKKQIGSLISEGLTEDEAKQTAPLILEAQKMLIDWEAGDKKTRELWKKMNSWVLEGFDVTYKKLGVDFDKVYFESDTYKLGKKLVLEGLEKGMFFKKEDGSVWADLTDEGLDQKILLRSDGTSVYMTQDLGTAHQRFSDYNATEAIYVVGNEQNYHFQVLKIVLAKLGFEWAENLYHLSYGMVELPEGKMKSREGTVVDADDLLEEMTRTADEMSRELGKLDDFSNEERKKIIETIGLGALKYFILKVDPKKTMTFDPKESIDFNGNTGPFIQYTYARIQSLIKKAHSNGLDIPVGLNSKINISGKELQLIKLIHTYPEVLAEAATDYSPAQIANYIYDLAKEFNQFYHDHPILSESNRSISEFRLYLSKEVSKIIKSSMGLLGIQVPERM